jgi:hypothetical protein
VAVWREMGIDCRIFVLFLPYSVLCWVYYYYILSLLLYWGYKVTLAKVLTPSPSFFFVLLPPFLE